MNHPKPATVQKRAARRVVRRAKRVQEHPKLGVYDTAKIRVPRWLKNQLRG